MIGPRSLKSVHLLLPLLGIAAACGRTSVDNETTALVQVTVTLTAPTSASSSSSLALEDRVTGDLPQAGAEVSLIRCDGADETLATGVTDIQGNVTFSVTLPEGEKVCLALSSSIGVDGIFGSTPSSSEPLEIEVNSDTDLALESLRAACKSTLGSLPHVGENIANCGATVSPRCVEELVESLADGGGIGADTVDGMFDAVRNTHRHLLKMQVSGKETPGTACALSGEATCQMEVSSLSGGVVLGVSVSEAWDTATAVLSHVVSAICSDTTLWEQIESLIEEEGSAKPIFNAWAQGSPSTFALAPPSAQAMRNAVESFIKAGDLSLLAIKEGAKVVLETIKLGGFSSGADANRAAVLLGAGAPKSADKVAEYARAAVNTFASTAFLSDLAKQGDPFGYGKVLGATIIADDISRLSAVVGGGQGVDSAISKAGGLAQIYNAYLSSPLKAQELTRLRFCGEPCSKEADCVWGYSCLAAKCQFPNGAECSGGLAGASCAIQACASGYACDFLTQRCVLASAQADAQTNFSTTLAKEGAYGGKCRSTAPQCDVSLNCSNGYCRYSSLSGTVSGSSGSGSSSGSTTSSSQTQAPSVSEVATTVLNGGSWELTCDATECYWIRFASGTYDICRATISGSSSTSCVMSTGNNGPTRLTLTSTQICWVFGVDQGKTIHCLPRAGGTETIAFTTTGVGQCLGGANGGLVNDGTNFYWGHDRNPGSLCAVPIGTNKTEADFLTSPTTNQENPTVNALAGGRLYFVDGQANNHRVKGVSTSGGAVTTYATNLTDNFTDVASDGSNLCWIEAHADGLVRCASLTDGTTITVASGLRNATDLAVSAGHVYVSIDGDATPTLNGGLIKVPVTGGSPTSLMTQTSVDELEVVGNFVYFIVDGRADGNEFLKKVAK